MQNSKKLQIFFPILCIKFKCCSVLFAIKLLSDFLKGSNISKFKENYTKIVLHGTRIIFFPP